MQKAGFSEFFLEKLKFPSPFVINTKILKSKMFTLVFCYFHYFQGGKIQTKNNQLFNWLKKEGKTKASACLMAGRSAL